ncbi:MAG: TetR/AcrR family transcriptional regulator [Alphaproteobacteria bacterium]|nr:TetR/AcrR family transcriptional regulator [Alphaproteobacteria bacterium]
MATTGTIAAKPLKRDPARTRERILEAATVEFSEQGLGGARVDAIADRAGTNKRMLYHYFGNKEDLFLAVLERTYESIRSHERELELRNLDPVAAVRELVLYTFSYFIAHPEFIRLLNNENLYDAQHVNGSKRIREMHSPLVAQIADVLERGARAGVFRSGVDPVHLYITIAAVGYFYLSNASTLSAIFGRNLRSRKALKERQEHAVDVVLGYLRPVDD